jgi:uncharacterized repeat protein (TIGR03803 family)
VLYNFRGSSDGGKPKAALVWLNGVLYGTTYEGGRYGNGVVFSLSRPVPPQTQWTQTVLFNFRGGAGDGAKPAAPVIFDSAGRIYGTTEGGGEFDKGIVYRLTPPVPPATAWTRNLLYVFRGETDGANPVAAVTFDAQGALLGTTSLGGAADKGQVFKLTPPVAPATRWVKSTVYNFRGGEDGAFPFGALLRINDSFFGTTSADGVGHGTVFRLTPPVAPATRWGFTVLHTFQGAPDGSQSAAGLVARGGQLFGTTMQGGSFGLGSLFRVP